MPQRGFTQIRNKIAINQQQNPFILTVSSSTAVIITASNSSNLSTTTITLSLFTLLPVFLVKLLSITIGLLGNLFVCIAIRFDRRLHNATNYFLFSLALADLLVCALVMPLSLLQEIIQGKWRWNLTMCQIYTYSDVFLCSASIVHMSVISFDRYLGISKPLKTRNKSITMIIIKIILVWLITTIISCPIMIISLIDPSNIFQNDSNLCLISNRYFMIYGSTFAFLIPFIVMAVTYVKTTNLLYKQANSLTQGLNKNNVGGDGLRRAIIPIRKYAASRAPSFTSLKTLKSGDEFQFLRIPDSNRHMLMDHQTMSKRFTTTFSQLKLRIRRNSFSTENQKLANEQKATRVLAVVFCCFFVCWTPFFAANFASGFCGESCVIPSTLASFFLWLGYFSSTINPIIYTIFNRKFRQAFLQIIRCQCFCNQFSSKRPPFLYENTTERNSSKIIGKEEKRSNEKTRDVQLKQRPDANLLLLNRDYSTRISLNFHYSTSRRTTSIVANNTNDQNDKITKREAIRLTSMPTISDNLSSIRIFSCDLCTYSMRETFL